MLRGMLYTAKCYWPGITATEFARRGAIGLSRASGPLGRDRPAYVGSLLFPQDDLVLCLIEGPTLHDVRSMTSRAGLPSERIMESAWLTAARIGARAGGEVVGP
jgi:hypothetical protein